jgi:hypothetical protein
MQQPIMRIKTSVARGDRRSESGWEVRTHKNEQAVKRQYLNIAKLRISVISTSALCFCAFNNPEIVGSKFKSLLGQKLKIFFASGGDRTFIFFILEDKAIFEVKNITHIRL